MKKTLLRCLITLFCFTLSYSFQNFFFIHNFNHDSVRKNIEYLSSKDFKGRLGGTLENYETALYIKNFFQNNNFKPYTDNYFQAFNTLYPYRTTGLPYLRVTDNNGFIVKNYKYGVNFKEDLLNFKDNSVYFNSQNHIWLKSNLLQIEKDNKYFLFYVPKNNKLDFRSSFISSSPYSMYVMITKDTFNELKNYISRNFNVDCFIPFVSKQTTLNNVVAFIEGKNSNLPPIILSAHFDHVGTDLNGTIYNGALDNASGTSFLMELSKYIKSLGKPERNIIFVAFNGEEFGCLGSETFLDKYKNSLQGSKVFNFDMIGSNKAVQLYIMGGKNDTKDTPLIREISSICSNSKIDFNYLFEDASDHEAFRNANIDAVTLTDGDSSRIHTPNDKVDFISNSSIDMCFNVISKEIVSYAFNNNIFILYYKQIFLTSLIGVVICYRKLTKI